jgi:site-specific DNA-methyltransferase (adenine-specific)
MLEANKVYPGDCLNLFKQLDDASIDLSFADPPFNLKKKYDVSGDDLDLAEYLCWSRQWIEEMVRVTKPTGNIFIHNLPRWLIYFGTYLNQTKAIFRNWIAWDATSSIRSTKNRTLTPNHYGILFYSKSDVAKSHRIRFPHRRCRKCHWLVRDYGGKIGDVHPFGIACSDCWTDLYRINHKKYRQEKHPCQLPLTLMERIILMGSNPGDLVLDPFLGTGTTAVAAKKLGRKYLGFELSPEYFATCERRIADAQPTMIGGCYVSLHRSQLSTIRDDDWETLADYCTKVADKKNLNFSPVSSRIVLD